ncbi:MAG: helix-turn-helix transcriptional regulator [Oscillospiraceae bacterium]|nr:helix-turn-helix transcriptional regulator [Oscillospiraceae bacterium]
MTLGAKLQNLRKQTGMSQETLAGQLGVSRQAVSRWELDISLPETENIIKLAKIFNVSFDYLLNEEITTNNINNNIENNPKNKITPLIALCFLIAIATGVMSLKMFPTMILLAYQWYLVGFDASMLPSSAEMTLEIYSPLFAICIVVFCVMVFILNKQRNK